MTQPATPGLEQVFTIEADLGPPRSFGPGPLGERRHIEILGGTVSGPRLSGRILPGGSDWPVVGADGHSRIEAHYTVEAEDGTLVYVHNLGLLVAPPEVRDAMHRGEQVPPDSFYFRGTPRFDVGDGPHAWLRERMFVCALRLTGQRIRIDVYMVT